jgi:DNA-directed RNA polymerase subunit RPC12/RpoP
MGIKMGDDYMEKDLDDQVYEDDYYEENYNEEELKDSDDLLDDDDDSYEEGSERKVHISYACEDCDYRWDDVLIKKKHDFEEDMEREVICPMCGSINITLI